MRKERRDANEREIIDALVAIGCEVWQLCKDEPADLLVLDCPGVRDLFLIEVKDGSKPPSKRKLTDKQKETIKRWPVHVVENVTQALQVVRGGV